MTRFGGVLFAKRLGMPWQDGVVALPLLATQVLWINLVTDGAPALALGVDPPDADLMRRPPRAAGEAAITARMTRGIVFVGAVMATGTLLVLDAALPGGWIEGVGDLPRAQTMAFTTLMLFQLFNVVNARSDEASAFARLWTNRWLWAAIGLSVALQAAVIYVPVLQRAFGTVALDAGEWWRCVAVASSVLWLREAGKLFTRWRDRRRGFE
jgi:Ca2+-transporting ATPase